MVFDALEFNNEQVKLGQNYLLIGSDAYLADRVITAVKTQLQNSDNYDLSVVYGDEVKSGDLGEYLDTYTIFSPKKLVLVKNAESMGKKELEILGSYYDSPSDIQSLVIVTDKVDLRVSAWKKIHGSSIIVTCDPPKYGGAIRAWLVKELSRMGKTMSPKAIEEFTTRIELDFATANNELSKINLFIGDKRTISEDDVLYSLGTTRVGTLIDFYRALGKRNVKSCIDAVEKMLMADWDPSQVFFQLVKFFSTLWRIALLKQRHLSDAEISMKYLNEIFQSQRKEYLDFAKSYTIHSLENILKLLLDTDYKLKSSSADRVLLLETCLIQLLET